MTDRDYVDGFKLEEECGFTSLNRAAKQDMKYEDTEEAEEFFECARKVSRETGKAVVVGTQSTSQNRMSPDMQQSPGRGTTGRKVSHNQERIVIDQVREKNPRMPDDHVARKKEKILLQKAERIESDPALGPRTNVKDEKEIDEPEALGKSVEMWKRENAGRY